MLVSKSSQSSRKDIYKYVYYKSDKWQERGLDKELLEIRDKLCYRDLGIFSWYFSWPLKEGED